jgi:Uma2 family endonuclease
MAVATLVPVEEYLSTSYRPDCDYVDGEVLERNVGERKHGRTQREIISYLTRNYPAFTELILPEQRVQVSATRFRVPDVCIVRSDDQDEPIVRTPPALCIEILSAEDRMSRVTERLKDYFAMGVPVCWIINPETHEAWIATPGNLAEPSDGILRAGEISLPVAAVLR